MRIAQVAPLYESVPPHTYGGTERVVSYITEELVSLGHDVTLFASGDSVTNARLVAILDTSLRLSGADTNSLVPHFLQLERIVQMRDQFDIVHFHIDYLHYPLSRHLRLSQLTTLHGRLDIPDLVPLYDEFDEMPVVSISDSQREPLPHAHWIATVHHGLPVDLYHLDEAPNRYLAFLGRVSPEKGLPEAIEIAERAGMPLRVAAKIDKADREYFDVSVAPLLERSHVEYIGEIGEREKQAFLGGAAALLSPVNWPEPFGLVLIEALACGTPVIAFARGSIPEIITDQQTGFIVRNVDEAVEAVARLDGISRQECRRGFEARFTSTRMAEDYLDLYRRMCHADKTESSGVIAAG